MISEDFFESIQQHYNKKRPFVVYRKPSKSDIIVLLQKDDTLYSINNYTETGFVFAPFDSEAEAILIPLNHSEYITYNGDTSDITMPLNNNSTEIFIKDVKLSEEAKKQHMALVSKGIESIKQQVFKKVVLSRCDTVPTSEENSLNIFKRLLKTYPTAFVYCWYHPKVGLWLGATPETLLKMEGNRFETMALAGTQAYKGSLDVIWQDKEIAEQQIVTDFIESSLQSSVSKLTVGDTKTVKAGNLLHLQTKLSGILSAEQNILGIVLKKLHPTPAVCGLPKDKAKQFILENENYNRFYYTGFLGELNMKQTRSRNTNKRNVENNAYASVRTMSNLFVNLRCMQLKDQQALIYVGGGVTIDSEPEKEWEETQKKAQTMKSVL